jgi:hypothetical protein
MAEKGGTLEILNASIIYRTQKSQRQRAVAAAFPCVNLAPFLVESLLWKWTAQSLPGFT